MPKLNQAAVSCPVCGSLEYLPCRQKEDSPKMVRRCVNPSCLHEEPYEPPAAQKDRGPNNSSGIGYLGLDKLPPSPLKSGNGHKEKPVTLPAKNDTKPPEIVTSEPEKTTETPASDTPLPEIFTPSIEPEITPDKPKRKYTRRNVSALPPVAGPVLLPSGASPQEKHAHFELHKAQIVAYSKRYGVRKTKQDWDIGETALAHLRKDFEVGDVRVFADGVKRRKLADIEAEWQGKLDAKDAEIARLKASGEVLAESMMQLEGRLTFTKSITLQSGGTVALSFAGNVLICTKEDRNFILQMFGQLDSYKKVEEKTNG